MAPSPQTQNPAQRGGRRPVQRAWVAVGLIPVAFVVAMVGGEGLIDALGYPSDGPGPPMWLGLLVGGPITLLAMAPAVLAIVYGRRARQHGGGRAATAATVTGIVVTAYWVLTSVAGVAGRLIG